MHPGAVSFDEKTISQLFGHEAAEDELPERLREYYFRSAAFEQVTADLPLRVLVGHKGIGKSALFQVARSEDQKNGRFAIELRPDDVVNVGDSEEFLQRIHLWKTGLRQVIFDNISKRLRISIDNKQAAEVPPATTLMSWVCSILRPLVDRYVNVEPLQRAALDDLIHRESLTVYIDDLDRGWAGRRQDIQRLSALLSAVRDLCRESPGLRFRIALRSDVFFLVRTADESTDKIQGSVIWYTWTNHEILALLAKRIQTYFRSQCSEEDLMRMRQPDLAKLLTPVIGETFDGQGKWRQAPMYRVLMSLIRRRPRDLIKLLTMAARRAYIENSDRLLTSHFTAIFAAYSQDRIQDTVNEYRSELPDVERLILGMRISKRERQTRSGWMYKTDELVRKVQTIEQGGVFKSALGARMTTQELCGFLYKVNFLIASRELDDGYMQRRYFEENRYLSNQLVDFGYAWEVHPAYRWALQPEDVHTLIDRIRLTDDESL